MSDNAYALQAAELFLDEMTVLGAVDDEERDNLLQSTDQVGAVDVNGVAQRIAETLRSGSAPRLTRERLERSAREIAGERACVLSLVTEQVVANGPLATQTTSSTPAAAPEPVTPAPSDTISTPAAESSPPPPPPPPPGQAPPAPPDTISTPAADAPPADDFDLGDLGGPSDWDQLDTDGLPGAFGAPTPTFEQEMEGSSSPPPPPPPNGSDMFAELNEALDGPTASVGEPSQSDAKVGPEQDTEATESEDDGGPETSGSVFDGGFTSAGSTFGLHQARSKQKGKKKRKK